ncbi:hypothetical protein EV426DRAFT_626891 [Tirmania nivea]|nr:hypothetical protein EV426DRAFT_626891 [Tirmania nivea]
MSKDDFDFSIFQGGSFTILLADPNGGSKDNAAVKSPNLPEPGPSSITPTTKPLPEYLVHRALLASVSPELGKHTNNDMKEGQEGRMVLREVSETTMERFLQWVYKGHYTLKETGALGLSIHTQIYSFAERFNIPMLKDEAFSNASGNLHALQGYPRPSDEVIMEVTNVFDYAFSNLPVETDPLLKVYAQYMAWDLEILRKKNCFLDLLRDNPDVAGAVIQCVRRASRPPWEKVSQHALLRYCMRCLKSEIATVVCPGCLAKPTWSPSVSGNREEYTVNLKCCSKGRGTYWMHENLVCSTDGCKGTGSNGDLSYPD